MGTKMLTPTALRSSRHLVGLPYLMGSQFCTKFTPRNVITCNHYTHNTGKSRSFHRSSYHSSTSVNSNTNCRPRPLSSFHSNGIINHKIGLLTNHPKLPTKCMNSFNVSIANYCNTSSNCGAAIRNYHTSSLLDAAYTSSFNSSTQNHKKDQWAATRDYHTSCRRDASSSEITVKRKQNRLELCVQGLSLHLPYIWLRDHCRSEKYYDASTNQKNADLDLLSKDLDPESVELSSEAGADTCLVVGWNDGHKSKYLCSWLVENFFPGQVSLRGKRQFWDAKMVSAKSPVVPFQDHMSTDEGLRKTLSNLVCWGFCVVDGVPVSSQGTQSVVERVAFVKETLFGGMWTFTADGSRSDSAYSTVYLGPHTDQTYYDSPAGLQVFHCLEHDGSGGETLLVDGFNAVDRLRMEQPSAFDLLRSMAIPHEYVEPPGPNSIGYHLHSLGTVVSLHPASNEIIHLRFNPYDRAPLNTVPPESMEEFYQAYDHLTRIIMQEENHYWLKLKPGMVVLIDNWRVMHGRAAFDGKRMMNGCYVGQDEWMSRARVMGAL